MNKVDITVFLYHDLIFHLVHVYILTREKITLKNENFVIIVGGQDLFANNNSSASLETQGPDRNK